MFINFRLGHSEQTNGMAQQKSNVLDDVTTEDFLTVLMDHHPTIPDDVIDYYLERTGFSSTDIQMKRLISVAAQKFISDISNDCAQYSKIRQSRDKKPKELVLRMDDVSQACRDYGITVVKPPYYADSAATNSTTSANK